MSAKNSLQTLLVAGQSLSATVTLKPSVIKFLDNISFQINITTSNSVGTFTIQGSDDYQAPESNTGIINAGHWVDLPLSGTPNANAANDSILIDMNQVPFNALRLVYTSSVAGTGTMDVYMSAKRLGG